MPLKEPTRVERARGESRPALLPLSLLFINGILFGLTFSLARLAITAGIPFTAFVSWYTLGAALVLLLFCLIRGDLPKLTWPHLKAYLILGVLAGALPLPIFAFVAPKLPAGIVGMTVALVPILTYLFALVLRMESFLLLRLAGIVLGFAGVLLIVLPEASLPSHDMVGWVLVAMAAPVSLALSTISTPLLRTADMTSHQLACGLLIVTAICVFPLMLATGEWWWFAAPFDEGDLALLLIVPAIALVWTLVYEIIHLAGPVFVTMVDNLATLTAVGWGILIFGESHSLWVWGALVLLLAGVYLVNRTGAAAHKVP